MEQIVKSETEIVDNEDNLFLLNLMTWSFSRLNSFYQCAYGWKLKYLECNEASPSFFGQYGSFIHKILEMYAKGELSIFEISQYYEEHFWMDVYKEAPFNRYEDIKQSYYEKGLEYLDNIDLVLENYEILGVEKEVKFKIDSYEMIGYIDLLLKDKQDGQIIILDHKSSTLKFKKNGEISKADEQHFLDFKRQLYLYSIPVIKEYGRVDYLQWNMFKDRKSIKIEWKESEYEEAIQWAYDTVKLIERETAWFPNPQSYYCRNLCGHREICEYRE